MNRDGVAGVPWSFWAIGSVGLLFNGLGCMNFLSQLNPEAVAAMPDAYRAIVETRPAWATGAFAIAVFGGALGSVLLLVRSPAAFHVLSASLLGAIAAQLPFLGMADFPPEAAIGGLMQFVVAAFLIWYSKRAERRGWIR